jgi:NAD(P)-dependent dehydrogenase (short-subunit alcohol dehydrogenase family)
MYKARKNNILSCSPSTGISTSMLTILITGSNQGLGYETARQLSKHSHVHLFLSGRNRERLQDALEKIIKEDECKAVIDSVVIDVSDDDSIKAGVKEVEAKLGNAGLDVLIVSCHV